MPTGNYFLDTYHADEDPAESNFFLNKYHKDEAAKTSKEPDLWEKTKNLVSSYMPPSWLEQATEQSKKDIAAYQSGGVPELMKETQPTANLAAGFIPIQTPIKTAPVPSAETLVDVGGKLIDKARTSGVKYLPQAVSDAAAYVRGKLPPGVDPDVAPETFKKIDKLNKLSESPDSIDFQDLHNIRLGLEKVQKNTAREGSTDLMASTTAKHALDDWLENPNPSHIISGDAQAASSALREGNLTESAGKAAEGLKKREYKAELFSESANSGKNLENTIRRSVASMLVSPEARTFTPEIKSQAENVVRGTRPENTLRWLGNYLGGGGGLGAAITSAGTGALGYLLSGGEPYSTSLGWGVGLVGGGALKSGANALAVQHLARLSEMLRSQAPMSQAISKTYYPGSTGASLAAQQALIRALISSQPPMQQQQ